MKFWFIWFCRKLDFYKRLLGVYLSMSNAKKYFILVYLCVQDKARTIEKVTPNFLIQFVPQI